ncbi:MAG: hypothetical protein JJ850_12385 [Kordiimonadaceae bacterium]|nr:hypothetical protein [Kordiimonadaceae bacterium]MBO6568611.1 hypothetical protein [Kordiimonadaceae bacterium]MBO6965413.1 hypothetical protein [Kordiimonadaceae bacterium]
MTIKLDKFILVACLALWGCSTPAEPGGAHNSVLEVKSSLAAGGNPNPPAPSATRVFGSQELRSFEFQSEAKSALDDKNGENEQLYTLDLVQIDIRDLVALILGEILDRNYIIDQNVAGAVTIHTSTRVRRDALIPILKAAAASQNAELVDDGQLVRFIAREGGSSIGLGGARQIDIMPVTLNHVSANQIRTVLLPLAKDLVEIAVDENSNSLVLSGAPRHMSRILDLAKTLDADSLAGTTMKLLVLSHADINQIMEEIAQVPGMIGTTRLVPIDRMNALLAVAKSPEELERTEAWVKALDQAGGKNYRNVYSYHSQSGKVEDLAAIASTVLGLGPAASPAQRETALPNQPPADTDTEGGFLQFNEPGNAVGGIGPTERGERSNQGTGGNAAQIVPDASSGQIIVYATSNEWQQISSVLKQLDQMPHQVMIEATILEVSLNDSLRYGLQFLFTEGNASFSLPAFASSGLSGNSAEGFSFTFDNNSSARSIIDALSSVTEVKVISSPRLMVLNNETATLQIGDQVPVSLQSAVPIEANDNRIINSIEFRDTGVIFRVTPRVGSADSILIDVDQEVSDVAPTTTSNIDSPTIRQRRVSSKLLVQNGETIAFAGLTRNSSSKSKNGIPVARDLPVIGPLFGSTENIQSTSELLVLLTPRIVKNLDDAKAVTDALRSKIRALDTLGNGDATE